MPTILIMNFTQENFKISAEILKISDSYEIAQNTSCPLKLVDNCFNCFGSWRLFWFELSSKPFLHCYWTFLTQIILLYNENLFFCSESHEALFN